jgi:hypothetical protein
VLARPAEPPSAPAPAPPDIPAAAPVAPSGAGPDGFALLPHANARQQPTTSPPARITPILNL